MRQLRIVPASGAATTSEALDVRPLHAHAQVPAQVAVASDELDFVMLDDARAVAVARLSVMQLAMRPNIM